MKVSEVMKKIIVVEKDLSLREAAKVMADKNIGCLVLISKDKIAGIVTEKDIVDNASSLNKKISSVAKRNIVTIEEKDSLERAAETMAKHGIKRLPVTNKGKLTGIITVSEIIENVDDLNEEFFFD